MAKKGRSQKNSSSTRRLSSRLSLNQHDTTTELHDNGMQETQHANIQGNFICGFLIYMYKKKSYNGILSLPNQVWVLGHQKSYNGRLLGVGVGFSTKDAYPSNSQSCNKRMCLEREESHEQLKDQVHTLTDKLNSLQELVERLMPNNSNNYARSGPFASMVNCFISFLLFVLLLNNILFLYLLSLLFV